MQPTFKTRMLVFIVLATVATNTAMAHEFLCPPFWVPFQKNCYRIFGTKLSWTEAEESCHTYLNEFTMAHLVSINSEEENRFVSLLWDTATGGLVATGDYAYWIGLSDEEVTGNWVWSDSRETATYTAWHLGQPDNHNNNEHCAHQWNRQSNGMTWNDLLCTTELYYVCKLPQRKNVS